MKSIYIILGIFCIVFVPFFLIACTIDTGIFKDDDVKARSSVSKKFSASKVKRLEASTSNGKIKSEVDNVDSIEVVFDKWATGHDEDDAKANLDDIKIYIDNDSSIGILKINVEYPHKMILLANYFWINSDCFSNLVMVFFCPLSMLLNDISHVSLEVFNVTQT